MLWNNITNSICGIVIGAVRIGMVGKDLIVNPSRDKVIKYMHTHAQHIHTHSHTHTHAHADCSIRVYKHIEYISMYLVILLLGM